MTHPRVFKRGRTTVEVYGGLNEIGGNCVVITDKDRRIVFDNGVRFSHLRKYCGGRIEPLGPTELRSIGAIPPLTAFEGALSLYVSHLHLDHVGLLSAVPPNLTIKLPSVRVFGNTLAAWYRTSGGWLAYVPPDFTARVDELKPAAEDEYGVMPVAVSHSSFPAYSFLYFGYDATIFYSGDLRAQPLSGVGRRLEEALSETGVDRVDIALLEGTNFSGEYAPMTTTAFRDYLSLLLWEHELVSVSIDPLDLETFVSALDLSMMAGRSVVLGSDRLLWMVEEVERFRPEALRSLYFDEGLGTSAPLPLKGVSLTDEVFRDPRSYMLVIEPVGLLRVLRRLRLWERAPSLEGSVAVLTDPEPTESIKEVEERVLKAWLREFGVHPLRLRLSGHYQPHEFRSIIGAVRPRELIPIHTREADLMRRLFQRLARCSEG